MSKATIAALIILVVGTTAAAQTFQSGTNQVPLIELYTSEGCSSCPPADRWLSSFKQHPDLWSGFVPVAFHVDYWDYIGWRDPFASREYSERQRRYAQRYHEPTVYTPGVRKAGQEWRSWRRGQTPLATLDERVGVLNLTVQQDGSFVARFETDDKADLKIKSPVLTVAILGLGLSSEVERGENHGKTLQHDFVVLGLSRFAGGDDSYWTGVLPAPVSRSQQYALAAWISRGGNPTPIQSTGGLLSTSVRVINED